jgi:protein phosphatase PTC7
MMASCAPLTALNFSAPVNPKKENKEGVAASEEEEDKVMTDERSESPAPSSDEDSSGNTSSSTCSVSGLLFDRGEVSIPHPDKVFKGGEDAYFVTELNTEHALSGNNLFAFGVADGVGGWASSGVDPAIFAQTLMTNCDKFLVQLQKDREDMENVSAKTPIHALRYGLDRTLEKSIRGSSTAMVCVIQDHLLYMANVGDSGLYILRKSSLSEQYEISFKSEDQLHGFNFPFQLGISSNDKPENALCATVELQAGDILIAASDGLFDNLFDAEVQEFICKNHSKSAQSIAQGLGHWAYTRSVSCTSNSPFAQKAFEIGSYFPGGKSDDITILVFKIADI